MAFPMDTNDDRIAAAMTDPNSRQDPFGKHLSTDRSIFKTRSPGATQADHQSYPEPTHKAVLEIPCRFEKGLSLRRTSRLNVSSSFPLYSKDRNQLSCHVHAISALRGKTGYTTGSATLKLDRHAQSGRRTSFSTGIGSTPKTAGWNSHVQQSSIPAVSFEMRTLHRQAWCAANVNCPKPTIDPFHCMASLSAASPIIRKPIQLAAHCSTTFDPNSVRSMDCKIFLRPPLGASSTPSLKPNWNLFFGISRVANKTQPSGGLALSIMVPKFKRFCSQKMLDVSLHCRGASNFQMTGSWSRKTQKREGLTRHRQVGCSVAMNNAILSAGAGSTKANSSDIFSWIFTWTEGDFTLRVPVLLSTSVQSLAYHQAFQFVYLSFLSSIIQDVVGAAFFPNAEDDALPQQVFSERGTNEPSLQRVEAMQQQGFMKRHAKIRMAAEEESGGLVIRKAIYCLSYSSNDTNALDDESFDVTIPLQFWVSPTESKLEFYEKIKRSNMLGFYDITTKARLKLKARKASEPSPSWREIVTTFFFGMETKSAVEETIQPIVKVWYEFEGRSYKIVIGDEEGITLPSARAVVED